MVKPLKCVLFYYFCCTNVYKKVKMFEWTQFINASSPVATFGDLKLNNHYMETVYQIYTMAFDYVYS